MKGSDIVIQLVHLPVDQVVITSRFGMRNLGSTTEYHNGLDLAPKMKNIQGDKLYATCDGYVVLSKAQGGVTTQGYGYYMVIQHDAGFCTLYAHMKALGTAVGSRVKAGQVIGYMGNTGQSTGIHTHFEIREGRFDASFWTRGEYNRYLNCIDPQPIIEDYLKLEQEAGEVVEEKPKAWLQAEAESAIKRLDLLTYGEGIDVLNSPQKWIQLINDPTIASDQFKNTSDIIAFIFIMLDRISQIKG